MDVRDSASYFELVRALEKEIDRLTNIAMSPGTEDATRRDHVFTVAGIQFALDRVSGKRRS